MLAQWSNLVLGLLPYVHIPDFGPLHPFGILVVIGILLGARIATARAKQAGLDAEQFSSLVFWTVASGLVISHVLDTIAYYPREALLEPWRLLMFWQGLSSFGGFTGAAIGFLVYSHRHRIDRWLAADAIAYGLPVGWLFGRMGCSVVHDHPGVMSDSFLAVNFPDGARFDLGLLELMLTPLLILAVIIVGRRTKRSGAIVATIALVYPVLRFPLDFLRAPYVDGGDIRYFGLTPGHYAAIGLFFVGLYLLWRVRHLPVPQEGKQPQRGKPARRSS
jgi:phosphatidylglycerol---prolipoprotein diacylglyceryl transferase